jgi:hypothetical protein
MPELQAEAWQFRNHRFSEPLPGYMPSSWLIRREVFETIGNFSPELRLGEDADWLFLAAEHDIVMEILPEVMVYRRLHEQNISRQRTAIRDALLSLTKASLDRRRRASTTPQPLEFGRHRGEKN